MEFGQFYGWDATALAGAPHEEEISDRFASEGRAVLFPARPLAFGIS